MSARESHNETRLREYTDRVWNDGDVEAIEEFVADGDRIAARWTATGTHEGELMGIEPTGNEVTFTGFELDLMDGGILRETWTVYDALGVLRQIGAVPELPLE